MAKEKPLSVKRLLQNIPQVKAKSGPAIFFHGHAKQYAVCVTVFGKQKTFYLGKDPSEAEMRYHQVMLECKDKRTIQPMVTAGRNMEFAYLSNQYLCEVKGEISDSQYEDILNTFTTISKFKPGLRIVQIDQFFIKDLKEHLRQKSHPIRHKVGLSSRTINKYLQHLRRILDWGVKRKYFYQNDICHIEIKNESVKKSPPRFLSKEEIEAILACESQMLSNPSCNNRTKDFTIPQNFAMIRFMLATGRRIQEIVHLKKKDINLERRFYEITKDKTEHSNPIPKIFQLNDIAIEVIRPYYNAAKDGGYIFTNYNGTFLSSEDAGKRIFRIFKRAGIKGVQTKEFRHSFASYLLMSGESLEAVAQHLGHTDIKTTQIYAHLSDKYLEDSINRLQMPGLTY